MGGQRRIRPALGGVLAVLALALAFAPPAGALPPGFTDRVMHRGLDTPISIAIAPDGSRFVAEKAGTIQIFSGPGDSSPRLVADLTDKVMSAYDRGLEAIALDPAYPARPYLYASYTYDAEMGSEDYPKWGEEGSGGEKWCEQPTPPDPDPKLKEGCLVSGRVVQLTLNRQGVVTHENVILEDWCQQFSSHSLGGIVFDGDGALLAAGGDGASFDTVDVGDLGTPPNACGDPPRQGGALRSQDLVSPSDPVGLNGTVVRVHPDTGAPFPGNPSSAPGNAGRIIAYGLRNPFRITVRPGTEELWVADVGWGDFEEINTAPLGERTNFGWPCYEGAEVQPGYAEAGTGICAALYSGGVATTTPWFTYEHHLPAVPRDTCFPHEGALSGIAFDSSRDFPVPYDGALFASDYVRGCIWSFLPGRNGAPLPGTAATFTPDSPVPVDLLSAPDGLYYADIWGDVVRRISYEGPTVEVGAVSRPRGAEIKLAGRVLAGPLTLKRGTAHRLVAPRRLRKGNRTLFFRRWSDGGRRIHAVVPQRDRTLRAIYRRKR